MATTADQTEPGRIYRRTRLNGGPGQSYYMRPKTTTAAQFIKRLRKQANPKCSDMFLLRMFRSNPALVLLKRYIRGFDFMTEQKWEISDYVLVDPEYRFREVKSKPGYR